MKLPSIYKNNQFQEHTLIGILLQQLPDLAWYCGQEKQQAHQLCLSGNEHGDMNRPWRVPAHLSQQSHTVLENLVNCCHLAQGRVEAQEEAGGTTLVESVQLF